MTTGTNNHDDVYVADDPRLSDRLRRFLNSQSRRGAVTGEAAIRSAAALSVDGRRIPAPEDVVASMVRFERRYGGLLYKLVGGNDMEYGVDGDPTAHLTLHGIAFAGILDGDWTWAVDVLLDGQTATGPGRWPHRIIDRSVDQRLEKHALLASVRNRPHRTFAVTTPRGVVPSVDETVVPPPIHEATGPADLWYAGSDTALEITLSGWPPEYDRWVVRYFGTEPELMPHADVVVNAALGGQVHPADWCTLCATPRDPDTACPGRPGSTPY